MEYLFHANVRIEIQPVSNDETPEERILREQAQARLDAFADDVARRLEAMLQPVSDGEAIIGGVLLNVGREVEDLHR